MYKIVFFLFVVAVILPAVVPDDYYPSYGYPDDDQRKEHIVKHHEERHYHLHGHGHRHDHHHHHHHGHHPSHTKPYHLSHHADFSFKEPRSRRGFVSRPDSQGINYIKE